MAAPTIVFDLDGTLVDTAPDLIDTLNVILARHEVRPVALGEARTMIGAGIKPLLVRALASHVGWSCRRPRSISFTTNTSSSTPSTSRIARALLPGVEAALDLASRAAAPLRCAPTSSNGSRSG